MRRGLVMPFESRKSLMRDIIFADGKLLRRDSLCNFAVCFFADEYSDTRVCDVFPFFSSANSVNLQMEVLLQRRKELVPPIMNKVIG